MSRPMPICEAIAAVPKHFLLKANLEQLTRASTYQDQHFALYGLQGHLDGLAEAQAISWDQWRDAQEESRNFLWGADA